MLAAEIGIILALTVINGLLAMSELAVVSARPARLKMLADRHVSGAASALALADNPGRFLSSVQIGITLVGVLAGAVSGATLGERLAVTLERAGLSETSADILGFGSVIGLITYLQLVVGELVPKQLALRNAERIACMVAPVMTLIARVASPLVFLLDVSSRLLLTLLGRGGDSGRGVTEEEIKTLVAEAESAGVLEKSERAMISGVLRLGDRPVRTVMTPRTEVDMIDLTDPPGEIFRRIAASIHSRLPAHEGDADEPVGIIAVRDLVGISRRSPPDFRQLVRPAPVIPESIDALDAVATLRAAGAHIGFVTDEYGDFLGVVTPADILESVVGAAAGEAGLGEEALVRRADGSLLVAGWMPADEFADALDLALPETRSFETAAGFVLDIAGRLPAVGETFEAQGWRFEVVDLDGRRIDKLLVSRTG